MKTSLNHLINSRILNIYSPGEYKSLLKTNKNYLFDLSYLGILDIIGEKATEFLQGQLTCDLALLSDIQMIQGAQCNLKGRILSLLDIINWNGVKLILPIDLIEPTQNSLIKTAQLSKVSIQKNNIFKIFGFYLQNPEDIIPNSSFLPKDDFAFAHAAHYCYYHLNGGFYIFIIQEDIEQLLSSAFIEKEQYLGSLTWHTYRLINKQLEIYPESRGLFLPHRIDLQNTKYISFNKGCYKGQEIIARTHYRATLKHELRTYSVLIKNKIYSGQKLFKIDEDIELGEVIDYSFLEQDRYLISVSILKEPPSSARFEGSNEVITLENPEPIQSA